MFKHSPRSFLWTFSAGIFSFIFLLTSFSIIVDPFGYFNFVNIKHLNQHKPMITTYPRLVKPHQLYLQSPANIIIGSSRVEMAYDPNYSTWKNFPGKTYNLGLPGLGIDELYKSIVHAYHVSKNLKLIVVALDFFMFNAHREAVVDGTEIFGYDEKRFVLDSQNNYISKFIYDIDFFLGRRAIVAGLNTLKENLNNSSKTPNYSLMNGMRDPINNPLAIFYKKNPKHAIEFGGQEGVYVSKIWRSGPEKRYCFTFKDNNTLEVFRKIVAFGHEKNLDLRFLIGPEHARMLIAIKEAGLWQQFEDWKCLMVQILSDEAIRTAKKAFPLWDFSGFNDITTEVVPVGEHTPMKYYWESSHYKYATAEIIIDKVLGQPPKVESKLKEVGLKLTPDNIENYLKDIRNGMAIYEKKFNKETKYLKKVVEAVLQEHPGSNCGYEYLELNKGIEALKKGEQRKAEDYFKLAEEIHIADKTKAQKLGVPFREKQFVQQLKMARKGKFNN